MGHVIIELIGSFSRNCSCNWRDGRRVNCLWLSWLAKGLRTFDFRSGLDYSKLLKRISGIFNMIVLSMMMVLIPVVVSEGKGMFRQSSSITTGRNPISGMEPCIICSLESLRLVCYFACFVKKGGKCYGKVSSRS